MTLTLTGITNDDVDMSVDTIRHGILPMISNAFGLANMDLQIKSRGAPPGGGGKVVLTLPAVKELSPVLSIDTGLVKRIRGVAYSTRVSPQISNRVIESARGLLNKFVGDAFIYSDHYKGAESGKSPGFGSLWSQKRRQARCSLQRKLLLVACYPRIWGNVRRNFFLMRSREGVASIRQHSPWRSC